MGPNIETLEQRYARVAAQWARQQRAYGQSVNMFHQVHRRWARGADQTAAPQADPLLSREHRAERSGQPQPLLQFVARDEAPSVKEKRPLTRRQFEVAGLIAEGMQNDEIARHLVITTGTAANHVEHILKRLGVNNRAAVAAWFIRTHARGDGSTPDAVTLEIIARSTART
jgi:DNA-binding NarL/FixJ family response regulator